MIILSIKEATAKLVAGALAVLLYQGLTTVSKGSTSGSFHMDYGLNITETEAP